MTGMSIAAIGHELNTASGEDIARHLALCDDSFEPALSSRVNLRAYAMKIESNAERFEAWSGNALAGLVAVYLDRERSRAYVTNVSVLPALGSQGIATALLRRCILHAHVAGVAQVALEVGVHNLPAIALYKRLGFTSASTDGATHNMTFDLRSWNP